MILFSRNYSYSSQNAFLQLSSSQEVFGFPSLPAGSWKKSATTKPTQSLSASTETSAQTNPSSKPSSIRCATRSDSRTASQCEVSQSSSQSQATGRDLSSLFSSRSSRSFLVSMSSIITRRICTRDLVSWVTRLHCWRVSTVWLVQLLM